MPDLTITYLERPNKPTIPMTGVYVGPTPDGASVVAHLYIEHPSIPSAAKHQLADDGRVEKMDIEVLKRSDLSRETQATVVMSPSQALAFGKWLQDLFHLRDFALGVL